MVLSSAVFIVAGVACLVLSSYTLYAVSPKEGKPPTFWTKTEGRSTALALSLVALFVFGAGLVLKGFLS